MEKESLDDAQHFILPWNVMFFKIGDTMKTRKLFASFAKVYNKTPYIVALEVKGKSPTGCVGEFKIHLNKTAAKNLADQLLKAF
jgi:hypothetical protein